MHIDKREMRENREIGVVATFTDHIRVVSSYKSVGTREARCET